jgi:diguanylate cyclase (GGDEF)-like protein
MQYINSERSLDTDVQLEALRSNIKGIAQAKQNNNISYEEIERASLRLTERLQRTLDIQALLQFFCQEITTLVPCDSTSYQNSQYDLGYSYGSNGRNICQFNLALEGQYLGELICSRNKPFGDQDLLIIESLAGSLVYPLRNALLYKQAVNMASMDPLTGVGNRNALEKAIAREQNLAERYNTPFSMLMIDIDLFKGINDKYGHSAGDLTIQNVSQTTLDVIRQSDQLFRYGGEEFVVLLNNSDKNNASFMAERIRQSIEQAVILSDVGPIKVTVSIGVAHFDKKECMDKLFNRADRALYVAKGNGRNQVSVAA